MKIVILGFSGSGKSTLAKNLSNHYNLPLLHIDRVQFLPNWVVRDKAERDMMIKEFIDSNESWVIDGNYTSSTPERFELADLIIFLDYNRFTCYKNAMKRYKNNKNNTRSDMADGCIEKMDIEFKKWVFYKGRTPKKRKQLLDITKKCPNHYIFKNRKQLFSFYDKYNIKYTK